MSIPSVLAAVLLSLGWPTNTPASPNAATPTAKNITPAPYTPFQSALKIAPSHLHTEHNSALSVTIPESPGESRVIVSPLLELNVEEAIYDWNITDFSETFRTLMEFSVYPLQPTLNAIDGKLDFIKVNKINMEKLSAAVAYVREIGIMVKQGVDVMSARSSYPVRQYFSEIWKPLQEVEAAFVHDRDLRQLMDHIECIDKAQAEVDCNNRKSRHELRPKVQYVFKRITRILEEKQANTEKFLQSIRYMYDKYENGLNWDMLNKRRSGIYQSQSDEFLRSFNL